MGRPPLRWLTQTSAVGFPNSLKFSIVKDAFGGLTVQASPQGISCGEIVMEEQPFLLGDEDNVDLAQKIVDDPHKFAARVLSLSGSPLSAEKRRDILSFEANATIQTHNLTFQLALNIVNKNAFALPGGKSAVFKFASLFNHSCEPNLDTIRTQDKVIMLAKRHVCPLEPLTINYLGSSILLDHISRNDVLSQGWGFVCTCSRCQHEMMLGHYADQNYSQAKLNAFASVHDILNDSRKTELSQYALEDIEETRHQWSNLLGRDLTNRVRMLMFK